MGSKVIEKIYSLKKNFQCKIKVEILGMICENIGILWKEATYSWWRQSFPGLVGYTMKVKYKTRKVSYNWLISVLSKHLLSIYYLKGMRQV